MKGLLVSAILVLVVAVTATAADVSQQGRVRQTLLYGIDSQVMDAIQTIQANKDTSFTPELAKILTEQRSTDLQKAVLDLFREQSLHDGEAKAQSLLQAWQDTSDALLISAVKYLSAIGSPGLTTALEPLVDSDKSAVSVAAIQALGATGDHAAAAFLVDKLKDAQFADARRSDCILALGALKDPVAVEALISIAGSTDEDKVRRMYAADSLGKIRDPRALPVLRSMVAENDALVRLYAASGLSQFGLDEVFPSLIQGLRDESPKVREQSAKSLARELTPSQADQAVPILSYKAEYDPESIVRSASIDALGAIGGTAAEATLLKVYSGADHPLDSREAALGILATKHLSASIDAIHKVVSAEWGSFDTRELQSTARVLSAVKSADLRDLFSKFVDSPDATVRAYGVRGIGLNGFPDLKDKVKRLSEQDPNPGTRREAVNALAKL